ncbi:hypothetical protein M2447_000861 [Ereboglobus sp. PH5-10]|uniref:hypothetical protein n=1 Tax=Ereboglobus sp. PH5-10 TaxID=2940629 RepID=UPI00240577E4|nr:hypothetical protein [Ereboglobus sp. PH5-10]MDF9826779.1 hypothetical protein [Ereboglobus sp. PH5-10]
MRSNNPLPICFFFLLLPMILAGCGTVGQTKQKQNADRKQAVDVDPNNIKTKVGRIHSMPGDLAGKTFVIVSVENQEGAGQTSFIKQAKLITQKLNALGLLYHDASGASAPDYYVILRHGVRRVLYKDYENAWVYARFKMEGSIGFSNLGSNSYFRSYDVEEVPRLEMRPERYVYMIISDGKKLVEAGHDISILTSLNPATAQSIEGIIYNGSATTANMQADENAVTQALAGAMFISFPGESGIMESYNARLGSD